MSIKNGFTIPFLLIGSFFLTACTTDQITLTLEFAVDAAATVAAVAAPQDIGFINLASSCLNAATSELDNMADSNLQKGTVILGECAKVEAGASGLTPLGMALANAVSNFLIQIKSLEAIHFLRPEFSNAFADSKNPHIDRRRLDRIKKKLAKIQRK